MFLTNGISAFISNHQLVVDLIGYGASILIFLSFVMTSVKKLRWFSIVGSGIFSLYALMIASYPTAIVNAGIVVVNAFYLHKMSKQEEFFTVLPATLDSRYLHRFVMFYGNDIQKYFPDFELEAVQADKAFFVYRDMTTASLVMGRDLGEGVFQIDLDYVIPQYRDMRAGKFIYLRMKAMGYTKLVVESDNPAHQNYMKKVGFREEDNLYVMDL